MADDSKTPAIIYAAKSTEDTRGSIPTQLADARAMAEREGWQVVGEFQDEGFSAYSGNRGPDLERAKRAAVEAAAEAGEAMLVVQHSDRLARGAGDTPGAADHLGEVYFWARRQNVRLRSVQDDSNLEDAIRAVLIGERNTEDSRRRSEAVTSGKDRQMERGERLGGPVPDGLVLRVERDAADRVVARHYERDPERAPIVERAFELSEQGHGDGIVARRLNAEGRRTKNGKPWGRRRVQSLLMNPIYAGRVARRNRHGERLDEPEVVAASNVEALIDPDCCDRLVAARVQRDRVAAVGRDGLRKGDRGGRPKTRFALTKLAVCDRCGERMVARVSPYKRKDGSQRRTYMCANVHAGTGVCDQPTLNAEKIDVAVVEYIDRLFVDFDAWQEEVERAEAGQRAAVEAELEHQRVRHARAERLEKKLRTEWLDAPDDGSAGRMMAEASYPEILSERDDTRERIERLEATLSAEPQVSTTDALLDAYANLTKAVRGADDDGRTLADLNERLRAKFAEFRLDRVDDDTVGVLPVLHADAVDVSAAYRAWAEAGQPDPTAEEIEAWYADDQAEEPIWAMPRPTAKPLHVALAPRGSNTHE